MSGRAKIRKRLCGPVQLDDTAVTLYTVPLGRRAAIRNVYLNNPSGSLRKATLSIGADTASTRFLDALDIAAGTSMQDRTRHVLEAGELIQGFADVADTVVAVIDGYLFLLSESTGFPDETNTGPTGALTPVSGDLTVSVNGTTVENELRTGSIFVDADNVTIRNCKIIHTGTGPAIANQNIANTNLLVEDVEIDLSSEVAATGIGDYNYTARRCEIYGGENHCWAETNVTIEDCYIHDNVPYNPIDDPHTDGIQLPDGAANIHIEHNTVYGGYIDQDNFGNSAITCAAGPGGPGSNITILNNLLAGGGVCVDGPVTGPPITFHDNRFSTIFVATVGGFSPSANLADEDLSGNVWHETGEPIDLD